VERLTRECSRLQLVVVEVVEVAAVFVALVGILVE